MIAPEVNDLSSHVFTTDRLIVRNLESSDFEGFHEMQSDSVVMQYTTGRAFAETENRQQLEDCIARYVQPKNDFWVWAITNKSTGDFIGTCAIVPYENRPEIGYRFRRKYFGQGYGQEVCDGLVEFAISELAVAELVAFVDKRNVASKKILDRSRLTLVSQGVDHLGQPEFFYRWAAEQ